MGAVDFSAWAGGCGASETIMGDTFSKKIRTDVTKCTRLHTCSKVSVGKASDLQKVGKITLIDYGD